MNESFYSIRWAGRHGDIDAARQQTSLLRLAEVKRSEESVVETTDETVNGPAMHWWHRSPAADLNVVNKENGQRRELPEATNPSARAYGAEFFMERQAVQPGAETAAANHPPAGAMVPPAGEGRAVSDLAQKPCTAAAPRLVALNSDGEIGGLGPNGLRLAFSLCGFYSAFMERSRQGETLTEREELLVTLARKDFASLRPSVVAMTLDRLNSVVNAPDLTRDVGGNDTPGALEVFAVATLRSLGHRANQLLQEDGPDAALALFGEIEGERDPLAIFQRVFTTALDLIEVFERVAPPKAKLLACLAEALDSEVEKI